MNDPGKPRARRPEWADPMVAELAERVLHEHHAGLPFTPLLRGAGTARRAIAYEVQR